LVERAAANKQNAADHPAAFSFDAIPGKIRRFGRPRESGDPALSFTTTTCTGLTKKELDARVRGHDSKGD
jgi:hypothetical protein